MGGSASKLTASALAGVLAVGMIPAAAFAEGEEAAEVEDAAAIELQAAPEAEEAAIELDTEKAASLNDGQLTAAQDGNGTALTSLTDIKFTADASKAQYVVPTKIKPSVGEEVSLLDDNGDFDSTNWDVKYYADTNEDGKYDSSVETTAISSANYATTFKAAGKFLAVVTAQTTNTDYTDTEFVIPFEIESASIEGIAAWNAGTDGTNTDTTKTEFNFNPASGNAQTLKFKLGDTDNFTAYTAVVQKEDAVNGGYVQTGVDKDSTSISAEIEQAGKYRIILTGTGVYAGSKATVELEVKAIDLSTEKLEIISSYDGSAAPLANQIKIGDYTPTDTATLIKVTPVKVPAPGTVDAPQFSSHGEFVYEIAPANANVTNAVNKGTVTYTNVATELGAASYRYSTAQASTVFTGVIQRNAEGYQPLDVNNIKVVGLSNETLDRTVTVYDITDQANPVKVADSSITQPGKWRVEIEVNSAATGYLYKGKVSYDFTVADEDLSSAGKLNFTYKGEVVNTPHTGVSEMYTGEDYASKIDVVLKDGKGKELSGVTKKLELQDPKNNTKWSEVTSVVKPGVYRLTATSANYNVDDYVLFTVTKAQIVKIRLTGLNENNVMQYTGSALSAAFEYCTTEADEDGELVWRALPSDALKTTVTYDKKKKTKADIKTAATEVKDAGFYKIVFAEANPASELFTTTAISGASADLDYTAAGVDAKAGAAANTVIFEVADQKSFVDVPADGWSYEYVEGISDNGWMTGYSDGTHFGPKDNMKRGDVCLVLYRMATGTDGKNVPNAPENTFSDVKAGSYWEDAIAWAADAGIVTGYSGKDAGKFGPSDSVTREQFVLMMSRYAKYQNVDAKSDGKAMQTKKDPQKVSSWAKDAVAWGVDGDMIGSNGTIDPQGKITREQIAKIVMVFAENNKAAVKTVKAETFAITMGAVSGGTADASATKAAKGEKVTITATSSDATKKATVAAYTGSGATKKVFKQVTGTEGNTATLEFDMPGEAVGIDVSFS